jgi:hypothetical protein
MKWAKASGSGRVHRLTAPNFPLIKGSKNVGFHPLRAILRAASANSTNKIKGIATPVYDLTGNRHLRARPTNTGSATAYDRAIHALIREVGWGSRSLPTPGLARNADSFVEIYFGPEAPTGRRSCRRAGFPKTCAASSPERAASGRASFR